ncbi:MAG TPA: phenylalanine--tRNA ligase subunit beta, partial [Solirubrobacteraceae bacterium]|nr:phenylalanine--tRNA ligase subunit beta [Solirubrobacteraceae bacterium]
MLLPLLWLHDYCDPGLDGRALEERLTMTGTKGERIYTHGVAALDHFVVGRVLSAERHPDADRLTVCMVAIGDGDTAQIVCGAPNVTEGQTVAVARPGAVMPGGVPLKKAKLRGVESNGMILAEDEVAIGTEHDGIMVLTDELLPGTPLQDVLPIATDVIELEVTPNRPDCLGVYGVAREVHASTGAPLAPPPWASVPAAEGDVPGISVEVRDPDLCPRFTLRLFEDVKLGPSPPWLKARLMATGQRPINNVVDVTNFVMLLAGQPMHAFDADLVAGGRLVVRRARDGETLTTLDDVERRLDADMCVIEDAEGPTSIAGIMGGARSEVGEATTRVLMEAATWNGPNIQRTATRLGLRTEASGRFEKQLAPEQGMEGQLLAAKLMAEVCGARPVGGTVDVGGPGPEPRALRLREARVAGLLGAPIPRVEQAEILKRLGFGVAEAPDGLEVTVPHWRRNDVTREADLVEEVGRIWGYDRLPATLPSRRGASGRLEPAQRLRRRAEDALVGCGVSEILGWSFAAPSLVDRLSLPEDDPRRRVVRVANPMSEEQSVLRTSLLGSLLDNVHRNRARAAEDVRLWEFGAVYFASEAGDGQLPDEPQHLGAVLCGAVRPATWRDTEPPTADLFAAKGVLAALMDALRVPWTVEPAREPFLHPGRAARVLAGGEVAGWLGEVHPSVAARWDLERVAAFELDFGMLARAAVHVPSYEDLTSYPAVRQDLAVTVPDDVAAALVVEVVR